MSVIVAGAFGAFEIGEGEQGDKLGIQHAGMQGQGSESGLCILLHATHTRLSAFGEEGTS